MRCTQESGTCNNEDFLFLQFDTEHPLIKDRNAARQVPDYKKVDHSTGAWWGALPPPESFGGLRSTC